MNDINYPDPEIDETKEQKEEIELVIEDNGDYKEVEVKKGLSESNISQKTENKVDEYMSDEDVPMLPQKYYIGIYLTIISFFIILLGITIEFEDKAYRIFIKKAITFCLIIIIPCLNGYFKEKYDLKVNYTRKINHISFWSVPFILDALIDIQENIISVSWNIFFVMGGLMLFMKPIRNLDCTGLLNFAFKTIDRPEDRPNTLKWLVWQAIGVGLAILPFSALWTYWDFNVSLVPIMIVTFGDGLAEPVGVKFGKHKYKVKGLCTDQEYTRSLEGSSVVFIVSVIMLLALYNEFYWEELVANLLIVPLCATISEALAPHTLDNPIIIITVASLLSIVHWIKITN